MLGWSMEAVVLNGTRQMTRLREAEQVYYLETTGQMRLAYRRKNCKNRSLLQEVSSIYNDIFTFRRHEVCLRNANWEQTLVLIEADVPAKIQTLALTISRNAYNGS